MKFTPFILLALCLAPLASFAQKLDIDGKRAKTNFLRLPDNVVPAEYKTYSIKAEGLYYAQDWGFNEAAIKDEVLKLHGYQRVETDGDLVWEVKMSPFRFLDNIINSNKYESKDSKTGKVTTTYKYYYQLTYEQGFTAKLTDKSGKVLWDNRKGLGKLMSTSTGTHKSDEFATYKEASDRYFNNRVDIQRNIASAQIRSAFESFASTVNAAYGFAPKSETVLVYTTDSKKHPENEAFNKAYTECAAYLGELQATEVPEAAADGLAKLSAYYKSVAEKYNSDEKADVKLRYACYFNLANIAYALDRPDESSLWAKKLIENGYDKSDGEGFIRDNEKLKEDLKKHSVSSRRFKRVDGA